MTTKAIVGEKVGMTQIWDRPAPGDTGDGGARGAGPGRAGEDPRARGLLRPPGDLGSSSALHPRPSPSRVISTGPVWTRAAGWSSCGWMTPPTTRWVSS